MYSRSVRLVSLLAISLVAALAVPAGVSADGRDDDNSNRDNFRLTLLHNNDGESKLATGDSKAGYGGAARFATVVERLRDAAAARTDRRRGDDDDDDDRGRRGKGRSGTYTVVMNHEMGTAFQGTPPTPGVNARISRLRIDRATMTTTIGAAGPGPRCSSPRETTSSPAWRSWRASSPGRRGPTRPSPTCSATTR